MVGHKNYAMNSKNSQVSLNTLTVSFTSSSLWLMVILTECIVKCCMYLD